MVALAGAAVSAAGSYYASKKKAEAQEAAAERAAERTKFIPYDVSGPLGSSSFSGREASGELSPEIRDIFDEVLRQSQDRFQQSQDFGSISQFLSEQFDDQFQNQRLSQESRLFNQGLLGSTAGGLQTEALREAQNDALLGQTIRTQNQLFNQGQGLLSSGVSLGEIPNRFIEQGGTLGGRSSKASQFGASAQLGAANRASEEKAEMTAGFFSSLGSSIGGAGGGFGGGA